MSRTFKVKGQEAYGVEIDRAVDSVTLRVSYARWPFPEDRTFPRSELIWMHGDREPETSPVTPRQPTLQEQPPTIPRRP